MASSNVSDWEEPLQTSSAEEVEEEDPDYCSPENRKKRQELDTAKLQSYVDRMAYQPGTPPKFRPYDVALAKPKRFQLADNYVQFKEFYEPVMRGIRLRRELNQNNAITTEQLEELMRNSRNNKQQVRSKEDLFKRKQELYYSMLTKLERQCRIQFLNVLMKNFAKFVAHLATSMRIPPKLVDPYARMQRGIFCNILLAIGVQPTTQSVIYYNSRNAVEYQVCHRLAHAFLSLIIKGLDTAAARSTLSAESEDSVPEQEVDIKLDNYIRERLMCAATRKLRSEQRRKRQSNFSYDAFRKCSRMDCN